MPMANKGYAGHFFRQIEAKSSTKFREECNRHYDRPAH